MSYSQDINENMYPSKIPLSALIDEGSHSKDTTADRPITRTEDHKRSSVIGSSRSEPAGAGTLSPQTWVLNELTRNKAETHSLMTKIEQMDKTIRSQGKRIKDLEQSVTHLNERQTTNETGLSSNVTSIHLMSARLDTQVEKYNNACAHQTNLEAINIDFRQHLENMSVQIEKQNTNSAEIRAHVRHLYGQIGDGTEVESEEDSCQAQRKAPGSKRRKTDE